MHTEAFLLNVWQLSSLVNFSTTDGASYLFDVLMLQRNEAEKKREMFLVIYFMGPCPMLLKLSLCSAAFLFFCNVCFLSNYDDSVLGGNSNVQKE